MTVENCIKRYNEFKEKGMVKAAENMKQHILTSRKFKGHPFLNELVPKVETQVKAKVNEDEKNVKKSKR